MTQRQLPDTPTHLTVAEAARVLRVGERTLRRYVHEGRIAYSRLPGGQLRFSREAVDALLEPAVESSA